MVRISVLLLVVILVVQEDFWAVQYHVRLTLQLVQDVQFALTMKCVQVMRTATTAQSTVKENQPANLRDDIAAEVV